MYWQHGNSRNLTETEEMTMRKFTMLLFMCFLTFSFTCQAAVSTNADTKEENTTQAITWNNQKTGYYIRLEDDADLLNDSEKDLLAAKMQEITAYGNAAFKSISYNSSTAADFAERYYHELFGAESGTLFLIDMDNRELYLFSDGAVNKTITSAYANTITDNVYRYASDSNYYQCASMAFEQIHSLLSGHRIAQPMKYISNALLALILAALINYFIVRLCSSSPKPRKNEILKSISTNFTFTNAESILLNKTRTYSPVSSSGSGGSHHSSSGGRSSSSSSHHSSSGSSHRSGSGGGHRF